MTLQYGAFVKTPHYYANIASEELKNFKQEKVAYFFLIIKYLKTNWKGIAIVIFASLIIAMAKANFKNNSSLAYSISSNIYRFAGVDKTGQKMTIANRVKKEADECLDGYAFSSWSFEKEAQIFRNDTIYGCTGKIYGNNKTKPISIK